MAVHPPGLNQAWVPGLARKRQLSLHIEKMFWTLSVNCTGAGKGEGPAAKMSGFLIPCPLQHREVEPAAVG